MLVRMSRHLPRPVAQALDSTNRDRTPAVETFPALDLPCGSFKEPEVALALIDCQ
jgi:hypothetical protein